VGVLLARPDFRRLFATRLVSQLSDGVFQVALASYVFFSPERQTSAGQAAAAFATLLLPYSLVGPFAGVLLDRWQRRQVLAYGNIARAGAVLCTAGLVWAGTTGAAFYLSALLVLAVNRFYLAALSAALPHVTEPGELLLANAVTTTAGTVTAVIGGTLGYLLRAGVGSGDAGTVTVLLASASLYAGSGLIAATMPLTLLGPDRDPSAPATGTALRGVLQGLRDGAQHVAGSPPTRRALTCIAAHRFCYGISTITTILLYRNYFNDPADTEAGLRGLGLVFAASALGFLTAALVTPRATARLGKPAWLTVCLAAAAVVEVVLGVPYSSPLLLLAAYLLGIVAQAVKITVDTIVQETVADAFRGRVFSLYDVLFNVSFVAAAALAAVSLPASGKSYLLLGVVAAGYALGAAWYGGSTRVHRRQDGAPGTAGPQPAP